MHQLKVNKLYIKGFKSYLDAKEISLGTKTLIEGDNAQGKTSIGEAITWAFLGTDLIGNERATTRLINKKSKDTEVIIEFTFDDIQHTLIRRKKGSINELYLDDKKINNADIARDFYKGKDIFLTIFNPGYFPMMTPKNSKEFLTGIMKEVDKKECLDELGDFLKEKLIKNKFLLNTVTFLKDKREELRAFEEDKIYLQGIIDGQSKIDIPEAKIFEDTELNNLRMELNNIVVKDNEELLNLINSLNKLNMEIDNIPYERPQLIDISYLEKEKSNLLNEYKEYKEQYDGLSEKIITCTKCGNEIDINNLEKDRLANILKTIISKGKVKAAEIEEAKKENQKKELQYSDKVNEYKLNKSKEIANVKIKIKELEDNQLAKNKEIEVKKQTLIQKISDLEQQEKSILAFNMNIENLKKQQLEILKKIDNAKESLSNNELKIKEIKLLIDAAKQFNSIRLKKQTEFIGSYLNKVKLQFERLTKDGELKDDFKITYEGREFNALSNAEKIKAGLEISNLVMNVLKLNLPIFVDNAESITELPELDTQVIIAKVVKGKQLEIA